MAMARCKAFTNAGDQCRNNAIPGTRFCYISSHGNTAKTRGQRARNFVRNNWVAFVLAAIPLAFAVYWDIHHQRLNATSGVISASREQSPMAVSVGSAEFVMLSKRWCCF
jgi:hypothetical protein